MTILYFTATGNGLYLAKRIGGKLVSIPKTIKEGNFSFTDDKIGIVFPIYGNAVPQYIRSFMRKIELNSDYIFSIMSYGFFEGGAVSHLLELGNETGVSFAYINTIKMVDNYLPGFKMEKQLEDEPKKEIEKHLDYIVGDINSAKRWTKKNSALAKYLTKRLLKIEPYKTGVGMTDKYSVEDVCVKCGVCAKVCPTDNIIVENAKPVFAQNCISCLSCTQNCPQNAIRLSTEKSKTRFRSQNISLKEIIESNS